MQWSKPAVNQVGPSARKGEFLNWCRERARRGSASRGLERCSSPGRSWSVGWIMWLHVITMWYFSETFWQIFKSQRSRVIELKRAGYQLFFSHSAYFHIRNKTHYPPCPHGQKAWLEISVGAAGHSGDKHIDRILTGEKTCLTDF